MAESYAPPDWKGALTGRQFERSGMQAYGAAKLFNIMLAKEYSKRLKVLSWTAVTTMQSLPVPVGDSV